jgi:hypothetical protein
MVIDLAVGDFVKSLLVAAGSVPLCWVVPA